MNRMKDRNRLWDVVEAACRAIENDGRLRSALRCAARCNDVIGLEATDAFAQGLRGWLGGWHLDDAAADGAMVLLAQPKVKYRVASSNSLPEQDCVAQLLGEMLSGERRRLSELRFQRLLRADGVDERLQQMRRAIALLEPPVHPLAVVEAWLDLHSELGRRRFARAYFTGLSVPDDTTTTTSTPDAA